MCEKILLSCTTFLSKENKYEQLTTLLDSLIKYNKNDFYLIGKFLIINEYSRDTDAIISRLKSKYSLFTFINKSESQKGQARSLNIIIDFLKKDTLKYWLHLEDSWICNGSFLKDVYNIMENTNISQLQFTKDWFDVKENDNLIVNSYEKYIEINIYNKFKEKI